MPAIDIIILSLIGVFILLGGLKGLIGQLSPLFALGGGILGWLFFGGTLRGLVETWFKQPWLVEAFASVLAFSAGVIVVWLIMAAVKKTVRQEPLRSYDTLLGIVLGGCKGLALAMLLVWFVHKYGKPEFTAQATIAPVVQSCAMWTEQQFELDKRIKALSGQVGTALEQGADKDAIMRAVSIWAQEQAGSAPATKTSSTVKTNTHAAKPATSTNGKNAD